ncbi:MAG: nucleotidyltransferase family protein [Pirellulales bacterium]|nr:nucleotidyltransferase family protein [Pirellulales bacterium]
MVADRPDKVVILARGKGSRMRRSDDSAGLDERQAAVADSGVKAMIPIDRPFLDYVLSTVADAGYRRVCLVIGPEHDATRQYYGQEVALRRLTVEFAVQQEPKGTANALLAAEQFVDSDTFAMLNSDNYYPLEAMRRLREHGGSGLGLFDFDSMVSQSNLSEERLLTFSVGLVDAEGNLERIIEKPDEETWSALPRPIWVSMNCWQFRSSIFDSCRAIGPSQRGEYELPDAVMHSMEKLGEKFRAITVAAPVLDLTSRNDIAAVSERLAGTEVSL